MSVSTMDYIPFNYQRYFQDILPAFEQASHALCGCAWLGDAQIILKLRDAGIQELLTIPNSWV